MEAQIIKKKTFYLKACIHHERFNINFLSEKTPLQADCDI